MKYNNLTGKVNQDIKTYKLEKVKQVKSVNLFDFSNIEKLLIDKEYKEKLKKEIVNSYFIGNDFLYILIDKNDFERCVAKIYIKNFNVYNTEGKRIYRIIDISACQIDIMERNSIYENKYKVTNMIQEKWYFTNESIDIDL